MYTIICQKRIEKLNTPKSIKENTSIIFIKQRKPHSPKTSLVKISKH